MAFWQGETTELCEHSSILAMQAAHVTPGKRASCGIDTPVLIHTTVQQMSAALEIGSGNDNRLHFRLPSPIVFGGILKMDGMFVRGPEALG
jgi:hypothetical protein